MKKIINISVFVLLIAASFACEDSLSPKGELKNQYVLNCILRGDTTTQILTLSRSYDVEGFDPYENDIDPAVQGAAIRIYKIGSNDPAKIFRDTTIARTNTSRYTTPIHYYYIDNFVPYANSEYKIEAELPDGTLLNATTKTYATSTLYFFRSDNPVPVDAVATGRDYLFFKWSEFDTNIYYVPKLEIVYSKNIDGVEEFHKHPVAAYYIYTENQFVPIYPEISNFSFYEVQNDALDRAMMEISEGDTAKSTYSIYRAELTVLIPDRNLTTYYSASQTFLEGYSVKLYQPEYTNIEGGVGIFGSYTKNVFTPRIRNDYVESFGYTVPTNN